MKFFLVFQNQTYKEERDGGYLWAPQKNKNGSSVFHWTNMTKVRAGDVIFSSYRGKLTSISIAQKDYVEHEKPSDFDKDDLWLKKGWMVKVEYYDLENPIIFKNHKSEILEMQSDKYAPFNKNGDGNQGYLFEVNNDLASYLVSLALQKQENDELKKYLNELEERSEKEIIKKLESDFPDNFDTTEKKQVIKSRIGQGKFRRKLEMLDSRCKVCGISNKDLLVASHIKPWKDSTNKQRLDIYNGFLLCPNHDSLFDKGFISFDQEGAIIISGEIHGETLELLNISKDIYIDIKHEHKKYLKWHRENVFIGY